MPEPERVLAYESHHYAERGKHTVKKNAQRNRANELPKQQTKLDP